MPLYVVCAGSEKEAQDWARQHNVPRSRFRYASSAAIVDGLVDFEVVRLPGFAARSDTEKITAVLRWSKLKQSASRRRSTDHVDGG